MKSKKTTIIISSIIVFLFIIGGAVFAVKALDQPSGSKKGSSQKKTVSSKNSSKKSSQNKSKSSAKSQSSSSSVNNNSSTSTSSSNVQTKWASLSLTNQVAILIQAAFKGDNGKPNDLFQFDKNYWDMTGSISNGVINRYVPNADSFSGISDLLSAKITISNNQITVVRPITAAFTVSLTQAINDYYGQSSSLDYTQQLAKRVVSPTKLTDLENNR
ncbi:RNA polymerase [Oenococcus oeni]|uniref:RNA polymerase n=1 Tax=Oenococcus oeni TaxID=1247 RepID=UPI0008F931BE|nr:RNA polymerase [Oenococcus oeni]OIM07958.1 RNA polymerase [Oenococcus oeni]QJU69170.1 RNA polymerase [Oenococcus oeni]